ncbi:UDP-4-amino-4,6-dideoxy-N-acetyl-beta-L-altrosamine N-acetyltransferase [Rhizobium sp. EC-SD404]|uniref:UDP-4-amino-4, 6-dideoxy-N-acetyl-beta-L-altrosamine N-acetyltransferase n=1 Tax=Rhizobium sp. EC-SD404 TaxID=2038389 RepID=UPI0012592918|nr:UDP-4-amino-4,6-dideoxy-N-acetyl-beta-L-altrosamine N-acetyltransferase [Rhizobium sp. EC-SD404]VVT32223.1 UDP-4-amino-4, 6-dideoxy-N-acetyl-beta-L-altrosamine N-acetyltransferase [Rhizobium sp. EC-SD404]
MTDGVPGTLRIMADDDLDLVLAWRNSPAVRRNMYTSHEISAEEHRAWWARMHDAKDRHDLIFEDNERPLGVVSFSQVSHSDRNAVWAFYAATDAPRGTGSQMEFAALDFAFKRLELHKLSCEVLAFNEPVIKLHHKFGFTIEGIFRQHHRRGEEFVDVVRLAILHDEWKSMRPAMSGKLRATASR